MVRILKCKVVQEQSWVATMYYPHPVNSPVWNLILVIASARQPPFRDATTGFVRITSEKLAQKFHTEDTLLPRAKWYF